MTFPLAPVLGGGALAAAAYALYKHFSSTPSESTVKEAMAAYTTAGPRGERVFTRDAAQGILRSLPGMGYSYPDPKDSHLVEIHPEKGGTPPASGLSAADWVRAQNRRMSVLAPVYLPMPTGAPRYLRLAPPGHEAELAPYGYAVLAYADAYHRPSPGQPVTGRPPISPRKSAPVPTPVSAAYAETPPSLHAKLTDVLKKPIKPAEGRALASDLARAGMPAASAVVAAKTNNATMQAALGMPAVPPGTFAPGWIAQIQLLLNAMGEKLAVDDKLGPKTRAAIKIFKRMHGLPENDTADNATFAALTRAVGSRQAVVSNAPDGTSFVSPHVTMNPDMYTDAAAGLGTLLAAKPWIAPAVASLLGGALGSRWGRPKPGFHLPHRLPAPPSRGGRPRPPAWPPHVLAGVDPDTAETVREALKKALQGFPLSPEQSVALKRYLADKTPSAPPPNSSGYLPGWNMPLARNRDWLGNPEYPYLAVGQDEARIAVGGPVAAMLLGAAGYAGLQAYRQGWPAVASTTLGPYWGARLAALVRQGIHAAPNVTAGYDHPWRPMYGRPGTGLPQRMRAGIDTSSQSQAVLPSAVSDALAASMRRAVV